MNWANDEDWVGDFIEPDWSIDDFLNSNKIDLSNNNPKSLLMHMRILTEEQKNEVLNDIRIQEYLKRIILTCQDKWTTYDTIFEYIDFSEITAIFDEEFIQKCFSIPPQSDDYILLASIFNNAKDVNQLIDIILNNDNLFNAFKYRYLKIISAVDLDNEHFKKLINRIIETDSIKYFKNIKISKENAEFIIKEDYPIKVLMWLIDNMPLDIISEFYQNDPRAELTIPYLKDRIDKYLENGIRFSNRVIKNPAFFEILKSESLLEFRNRINLVEQNCDNPDYIEQKIKQYYEEIINSYQEDSSLFEIYEELINNPDKDLEETTSLKSPYIISREFLSRNGRNRKKLQEEANLKLSEVIVDALFQDNIYNVWINIKELLEYNNSLPENERPVSKKHLELYALILKIDKLSSKIKLKIYNSLKDKNINLMFYHDLRKTKDLAYKKIKEKMINPLLHPEYENKEETAKNGVTIYDLRDKEYYMLVRTLNCLYSENQARRYGSSYTLISNNNTSIFTGTGTSEERIIYGYVSFDSDKVEHMFEFDSFSTSFEHKVNNPRDSSIRPNRIATAEKIADTPGYSEVILKNQRITENVYSEMKPDFIVVIDQVDEASIAASKRLNIPIVIIKGQRVIGEVNNMRDETEGYTQSTAKEEERRKKRK